MDFAFLGDEGGGDKLVVLVVKERTSRMLAAIVVPCNATGEFVAKRVIAFCESSVATWSASGSRRTTSRP